MNDRLRRISAERHVAEPKSLSNQRKVETVKSRMPTRVLELRSIRGTGGGPEKTILTGTAATDPSRYAITVTYLRDARDDAFDFDTLAKRSGIDYVELIERHSFDPSIWTPLRRLVRERGIHIVHAHEYKTNVLAWLLSKFEGVAALSTAHGWTGHSRRERLVYYPADKRLLARFSQVIAVSSEIRTELSRYGADPARTTVILNGIDHTAFRRDPARRPAIRAQLGFAESDIVIGSVGRLEPQKRFDILMKAVARVRVQGSSIRLIIAGEGSARPMLERQLQELRSENVCRLLGHTSDVPEIHHAFDLFVQSSDYEGTPNAVLEAMALETPIVATDVGGTSELIENGEHGLVVPPGDPAILASAIQQALDDRTAARRRAVAARARVEKELSFERRMQRVEGVYDAVMERRFPGRQRPTMSEGALNS